MHPTGSFARWRGETVSFLRLSAPLVGAQIAQMANHAIDVLMIGRIGAESLAASVLGVHFFIVFLLMGLGLVGAVSPLAGRALGRLDLRLMRRVVRMGLWMSVLYCIVAGFVIWFASDIFLMLGQDPVLAQRAGDFICWQIPALLFSVSFVALRNFIVLMELTRIVLWISLLATLCNAFANYVLIFGKFGVPALGLTGAALATDLASLVGFAALVGFIVQNARLRRFSVFGRLWRVDFEVLARLFRVGLPIGLTLLAEAATFSVSSIFLGWVGTLQLAAHGVALQLASITFMVPLAFGQAAAARISVARGREDFEAIARIARIALGLATVFMLCAALAFLLFPQFLIGLFLSANDPDTKHVIAFGVSYLIIGAFFQLFDGVQVVAAFLLRGLADTKVPMIISVIGYVGIGTGSGYVLGFVSGLGGVGVWIGLLIGLATVSACLLYRFARRDSLGLTVVLPARGAPEAGQRP